LGQLDEAERVLRKGTDFIPFGHEHSEADALSHYALGCFLRDRRRNYREAKYHLRQAVYKDGRPQYYEALQNLNMIIIPEYGNHLATAPEPQMPLTSPLTPDSVVNQNNSN
ncbi:hypothetical protein TI03_03180, partial [Achromatium sp. WMS1]